MFLISSFSTKDVKFHGLDAMHNLVAATFDFVRLYNVESVHVCLVLCARFLTAIFHLKHSPISMHVYTLCQMYNSVTGLAWHG